MGREWPVCVIDLRLGDESPSEGGHDTHRDTGDDGVGVATLLQVREALLYLYRTEMVVHILLGVVTPRAGNVSTDVM